MSGTGYATDYLSDKDGRAMGVSFADGTGTGNGEIRYDSLGRVSGTGTYRKDSGGAVHSLIWNNNYFTDTPDYKTQSEILMSNTVIGNDADTGSTNTINLRQNYSYDGNSLLTGITTQRTQNGTTTIKGVDYVYDEAGQLTRVNDQAGSKSYTYKYDAGGNISERKEYAYTTGTLGTPNLTIPYLYGDANWKDKLTSYNGKALTYNTNGQLSTYDGWTYTWQAGRQLAGMSRTGTTAAYTYNASGLRTSRTVNGTTTNYTLVGSQITHEKTGTAQMDYYYDGNGQLVSIFYSGSMYYYLHNILGEITGLVDGNGNLVVEYTYDPYGKVAILSDTSGVDLGAANPFRYKDYYLDGETGYYYLQSRYYSPEWGRFISSDDTSILMATQGSLLGANLFAYCGNCPVMGIDPSGYFALVDDAFYLLAAIIAVSVITVILIHYINTMPEYRINGSYFKKWLSDKIGLAIFIPLWVYTTLIKAFKPMSGKSDPHDLEKGMTARQREIFQREIEKYKRERGMKPNDNIPWKILCMLAEIARQSKGR
ncbi:MAG: RHS repeat domain-containing protein [Saccharofermentanales bacterium]